MSSSVPVSCLFGSGRDGRVTVGKPSRWVGALELGRRWSRRALVECKVESKQSQPLSLLLPSSFGAAPLRCILPANLKRPTLSASFRPSESQVEKVRVCNFGRVTCRSRFGSGVHSSRLVHFFRSSRQRHSHLACPPPPASSPCASPSSRHSTSIIAIS